MNSAVTNNERPLLIGCGILKREIRYLIEKNGWSLDTLFLASTLHIDLDRLGSALAAAMAANQDRRIIVFYGCCHPKMDSLIEEAGGVRTCGENCVEMLLGHETYFEHLKDGAFFLLEDWAGPWEKIMMQALGTQNINIIRDIFNGDRNLILGIRTPCSHDFTDAAEKAGRLVDSPVTWMNASLDHLEKVLAKALSQSLASAS